MQKLTEKPLKVNHFWRALPPAGWDITSRNIAEACEEAKVKMKVQAEVKPACMYVKATLIVDMVA